MLRFALLFAFAHGVLTNACDAGIRYDFVNYPEFQNGVTLNGWLEIDETLHELGALLNSPDQKSIVDLSLEVTNGTDSVSFGIDDLQNDIHQNWSVDGRAIFSTILSPGSFSSIRLRNDFGHIEWTTRGEFVSNNPDQQMGMSFGSNIIGGFSAGVHYNDGAGADHPFFSGPNRSFVIATRHIEPIVPEPSSANLVLLGIAAIFIRRRLVVLK